MTTRIYVPRETAAVSVGADDIAVAIARHAKENGDAIELVVKRLHRRARAQQLETEIGTAP